MFMLPIEKRKITTWHFDAMFTFGLQIYLFKWKLIKSVWYNYFWNGKTIKNPSFYSSAIYLKSSEWRNK